MQLNTCRYHSRWAVLPPTTVSKELLQALQDGVFKPHENDIQQHIENYIQQHIY